MRSHPTQVPGYSLNPPSFRSPKRVRRSRYGWAWLILALNASCLIIGMMMLRRQATLQVMPSTTWRSPLLSRAAMLVPSSYAAPLPTPSADSLEALSRMSVPKPEAIPEASESTPEPSTGDRVFLNYGEWLEVLKQEANATATAQPERLAVLAGDSISLWFPPKLLPSDRTWLNQGISGETSAGLLKRLSLFDATAPDTIFVMIGINDLIKGFSADTVAANQALIIEDLQAQHPNAQIVIQSILPHAGDAATWEGRDRLLEIANADIQRLNSRLLDLSDRYERVTYLDLYTSFADSQGNLRMDLSTDGLHLNEKGYQRWRQILQAYSLTTNAALEQNQ